MRFIQEFGFTVRRGQHEAFQRWLIEHEEELARSFPEGTRYVGTFATVYSSEKHAGEFRVFIEMDSYGAQDRLAAAGKDAESEHGRLLREVSAFIDNHPSLPSSSALHKAVVDATIWEPQRPSEED